MGRRTKAGEQRSMVMASRAAREKAKRGLPQSYDALRRSVEAQAAKPEDVGNLLAGTPDTDRAAMIGRLYRAFEAQVEGMEARLQELVSEAGAASIAEIDKTVKTLASLARTLTLLLELKKTSDNEAENDRAKGKESEDDECPDLSPDALREALAARLDGLCGQ
ncbi:hypothetical protein [Roseibium sp.]|uniref:hypothetical protein n=1 Tax=Roseibium sp. TaxID=1936156 RepID=UPI003A970F6C